MGCCSSQPADGDQPKPSQTQGANGPKAAAGAAAGKVAGAAHNAAGTAQNTAAKVANAVPGVGGKAATGDKSGAPAAGAGAGGVGGAAGGAAGGVAGHGADGAAPAAPIANHTAPPDQTAASKAAGGVSQAPVGSGGSASAGAADNNGDLAAASQTAAAAMANGPAAVNSAGARGAATFASPPRPKPTGSPKPASSGTKAAAERPRWGARPGATEGQATRKGGSGRLSFNEGSPVLATPPRRRTAGDTAGGAVPQNSTPDQRRASSPLVRTPSYMLATSSSKSKVFTTPPTNRSRNEGRRPYGLMEPSGGEEQP